MPTSTVSFEPSHLRDWRCRSCFKLLGKRDRGRVQVRMAKGEQYVMNMPVTAVCRCGKLNELIG